MPTYEYACRDCGEHLEVVQSFKDEPLTVCGSCGGGLRKVFSAAGIIFKGSGYYVTDTRGGKGAPGGKAPAPSGAGEGGSDSSGGDGGGGADSSKSDSAKSDSGKSDSGKSDRTSSAAKSA